MVPGAHDIKVEELAVGSWAEFRKVVQRIRRRYPAVTANPDYLREDRPHFGKLPVIYGLVFRGQTGEIPDGASGRPLLLPTAFRPNRNPSWVHKGPLHLWNEMPMEQDISSAQSMNDAELDQLRLFREALTQYCLEILRVDDIAAVRQIIEEGSFLDSSFEMILDRLFLYARSKRDHICIMRGSAGPHPPLRALLRDVFENHDIDDVYPLLRTHEQLATLITAGYVRLFLSINGTLRTVATAILQHYGLPTTALDVTFNPYIALWFSLHQAVKNDGVLVHEPHDSEGYVYALWVPITLDWGQDGGRYYAWARKHGEGLRRLLSPMEPALFADLSAGMALFESDNRTRGVRQRAALLTGLIRKPEWPRNAYGEYVVAKMKVAPTLLSDVEGQAFARRYRSDVLFPSPQDDRLLHALLKNGIQGLEVYG